MSDQKTAIIAAYLDLVKDRQRLPSQPDLTVAGYSKSQVKYHFGNLTELHRYMAREFGDVLSKFVVIGANLFTKDYQEEIDEAIDGHRVFVITTAVVGKKVDPDFYAAIKTYCEARGAKLLIMPCADVRGSHKQIDWAFDPLLTGETFITKTTWLNSNLFLSNIHVSAKQIKPTTGLTRMTRDGSCILASPKQFLEFVAVSPSKERVPRALMTTGAITEANYENDFYMSQRTSAIAEFDHLMGAIIVEVVDDELYHFRQIQMCEGGSFVDLGIRYSSDGVDHLTVESLLHFYGGDWHAGDTDPELKPVVLKFMRDMKVVDAFYGDFYNGHSISHHHIGRPTKLSMKYRERRSDLVEELQIGIVDMKLILDSISGTLYLIRGNHDEVLERYLDEGRYHGDIVNHYAALQMAIDMHDGKNPLEEAYKRFDVNGDVDWSRVVFLTREESLLIGGVEMATHGDKGNNGARASLQSQETATGACIVGHAHSPAIFRGVFRVGTFTKLNLEYNVGPSSWMQTGCLITEFGERQLINFINGEYTTQVDTIVDRA